MNQLLLCICILNCSNLWLLPCHYRLIDLLYSSDWICWSYPPRHLSGTSQRWKCDKVSQGSTMYHNMRIQIKAHTITTQYGYKYHFGWHLSQLRPTAWTISLSNCGPPQWVKTLKIHWQQSYKTEFGINPWIGEMNGYPALLWQFNIGTFLRYDWGGRASLVKWVSLGRYSPTSLNLGGRENLIIGPTINLFHSWHTGLPQQPPTLHFSRDMNITFFSNFSKNI